MVVRSHFEFKRVFLDFRQKIYSCESQRGCKCISSRPHGSPSPYVKKVKLIFAAYSQYEKLIVLFVFLSVPCLSRFFVTHNKKCFLCGRAGAEEDFEHFITCPNDNCKTVYCKECFEDMQSKCTACLQPIDYGDLTDASEEMYTDIL